MNPAGLEPAIPGSVGRCLIHWATGPLANVYTTGFSATSVATRRLRVAHLVGVHDLRRCVSQLFAPVLALVSILRCLIVCVFGVDLVAVAGGCNYVLP